MNKKERELFEEIYAWLKDLDSEDGRDYVSDYIEILPKVEEILGVKEEIIGVKNEKGV